MMRFVILTQYYSPEIGAPQTRLRAIARKLTELGHSVEIVTAVPNHLKGQIYDEYKRILYTCENTDGIIIHRVWMYAATGAGLKRLVGYLTFMITCMYGLFRSKRPDYLFVESPPLFLSIPAFIASKIWKTPIIFNVADLWPDSVKELGIINNRLILTSAEKLERWTYSNAEIINAVTEGIRDVLITEKGVNPRKVTYLPNGVDIELFYPQNPDLELQHRLNCKDCAVFLYAGTHGYAQGLEVIIEAALKLSNEKVKFIFVGDGPVKAKLIRMKEKLNTTNVIFEEPQPIEMMPKYYSISTASIVCLKDIPIFDGARPSKIFPSLSCGIPVIYSGKGEGARLIEETHSGIVVQPENSITLAKSVMNMAENREHANKLGQNGRKYVLEYMNWSLLIKNWLKQLQESNNICSSIQ